MIFCLCIRSQKSPNSRQKKKKKKQPSFLSHKCKSYPPACFSISDKFIEFWADGPFISSHMGSEWRLSFSQSSEGLRLGPIWFPGPV